jgi:hypothetical protein
MALACASPSDDTQGALFEKVMAFAPEEAPRPLENRRDPGPRAAAQAAGEQGALHRLVRGQRPVQRADSSVRPLDRVVALQRADGSWVLDDELAKALGWRGAKQLRKALGRELSGEPEERAAATALALAWLERECADTRDEWRILADKGREWLSRRPDSADGWITMARDTLDRR